MTHLLLCLLLAANENWSDTYVTQALQGDVSAALARLAGVGEETLEPADAAFAAQVRDRFGKAFVPPPPEPDSLLDRVLGSFQRYWHGRLTGAGTDEKLESALMEDIAQLLDRPPSDDLLNALAEALKSRGFHSHIGRTIPLLDLFVWRSQESVRYDVELPDGHQSVTVVFMDDFRSLGWSHYATFGRAYAGGWVGERELYCIAADYDPDSEKFLVSYLKHESQHFQDRGRFPDIAQEDLEYRAKLVELIYADETLPNLLTTFERQGVENSLAPHAAANWRVINDLRGAIAECGSNCDLNQLAQTTVRSAADRLLRHDTRIRLSRGPQVR